MLTLNTAKIEWTRDHLNSGYHLPKVALSILKIRNYQQTPNEIMKNQGEKKRKTKSNTKTNKKNQIQS